MDIKRGITAIFILVLWILTVSLVGVNRIPKVRTYREHQRKAFSNAKDAKTPLYELDGTKFLYPCLDGGPNNQLIGLMKSIYLAIESNR